MKTSDAFWLFVLFWVIVINLVALIDWLLGVWNWAMAALSSVEHPLILLTFIVIPLGLLLGLILGGLVLYR